MLAMSLEQAKLMPIPLERADHAIEAIVAADPSSAEIGATRELNWQ